MENYPSYNYPDSGDSSPRSREIDFENPPPSWEDQQQPSQPPHQPNKLKFMVSYAGKIQPRPHDNLLSYIGGETKILAVDRTIKYSSLLSKLSSILSSDPSVHDTCSTGGFTFKYQLPGEDLDALISVTNDDDLENMMHEYDRSYRGSAKPARLRIFLFPVQKPGSFGSTTSDKIERDSDRFVDALNSGPPTQQPLPPQQQQPAMVNNNNMDFLFGLDNKGPGLGPVQGQIPVQVPVQRHEPDPQIDARIQELNRMQISAAQEMNRTKSEDGTMYGGAPASIPASVQIPAGYWQQQQQQPPPPQLNMEHHQQQPPQPPTQSMPIHHNQQTPQFHHQNHPQNQQVYMVHAPPPGNVYHAPPQMIRPVGGHPGQGGPGPGPGQGYYQVQRVAADQHQQQHMYREQQQQQGMYNMGGGGGGGKMGGYSQQMAENGGGGGYAQVAYDNGSGRQVYYAAATGGGGSGGGGGVAPPFQGVAVSGSGEMRGVAAAVVDPNKVQKVVPTSGAV